LHIAVIELELDHDNTCEVRKGY